MVTGATDENSSRRIHRGCSRPACQERNHQTDQPQISACTSPIKPGQIQAPAMLPDGPSPHRRVHPCSAISLRQRAPELSCQGLQRLTNTLSAATSDRGYAPSGTTTSNTLGHDTAFRVSSTANQRRPESHQKWFSITITPSQSRQKPQINEREGPRSKPRRKNGPKRPVPST